MDVYTPRILSLCTGYGGIELGFKWIWPGAKVCCYVEKDDYCVVNIVSRIQEGNMDDAPIWDDVATFDAAQWRGVVDWIVGGYPCQPYSAAGKALGNNDSRNLWRHFKRIIGEIHPEYCFFENVSNHLNKGFEFISTELQEMGYEVAAITTSADELGVPHQRNRMFALCKSKEGRAVVHADRRDKGRRHRPGRKEVKRNSFTIGANKSVECERLYQFGWLYPPNVLDFESWESILREWPTLHPSIESCIRQPPDGHSHWMDEYRCNGNGVVPLQSAYALASMLLAFE